MEKSQMETEGRYTLVGMLVLAVIAVMALAIAWLAGAADTIAYQTYTVYFRQQSLDGLAVGSPVKMRGIKVGVVEGFHFARNQDEAVAVTARVDTGVPVHQGAAAYIKRNLVTGIAALEISNGNADNPLLDNAPKGERYPVIAEGRSDIDKVTTAVSRLAVNGALVLEKMNAVLSDDNQRALSQTLANLNTLSGQLAADKHNISNLIQGVNAAASAFRQAGISIGQTATSAEGSIVAVGQNTETALKQAVIAMDQLQREASQVSARLQLLGDTGTLELNNVSREVRTSADVLTTAGQRLSDPRAILFGSNAAQLGPGEQQP
jgi:phospholipid/cholesterol/gamma-HCH transport system substrate-binding protein